MTHEDLKELAELTVADVEQRALYPRAYKLAEGYLAMSARLVKVEAKAKLYENAQCITCATHLVEAERGEISRVCPNCSSADIYAEPGMPLMGCYQCESVFTLAPFCLPVPPRHGVKEPTA